jgi:putative SOS response-associated peptidase YedK
VFRRREEGVELVQLRWGFPPAPLKGAPVINFRSEGRRFPLCTSFVVLSISSDPGDHGRRQS